MSNALVWPVWLPLAGAGFAFLLGRRWAPLIGMLFSAATSLAAFWTVRAVWTGGEQRYALGGWAAPVGIELGADGLSAVMLSMTAAVGLVVSVYSLWYFGVPTRSHQNPEDGTPWQPAETFWPLWLFLWAALNAIFLSRDIFNMYVGLEVMGLAAVALVVLAKAPVAQIAGMQYLLAALIGSLLYLMGVAVLYAAVGTLDLTTLGARLDSGRSASMALVLMTVGLMLKTALFPLHFWLPAAHANAPVPVSAVLSALVVKASFYLLVRLWMDVYSGIASREAAQFVGVLATAAIFWGSIQAIRQTRLKLLVAYSTIAQVGYLFLLIPLGLPASLPEGVLVTWNLAAIDGGCYQALSHALAKAAMFLAAGVVMQALGGTDTIADMAGIAVQLPVTTFAFGLAGVSLMGLPPSGGFLAKWLLLTAVSETGQWWWVVPIIGGGLLSAVYMFKFLGQSVRQRREGPPFQPVSRWVQVPALALAAGSMLIGLRATPILDLLRL
jgi:multicomponent Na+:H+ antiporter subunit D